MHLHHYSSWLRVTCFALLLPGIALSQQVLEPEPTDTAWEQWTDQPPVTGGLRVGIMINADGKLRDPEFVFVALPVSDALSLCLEVSSRDARYSASLEYDLEDVEPGDITLHFPTVKKSRLAEYERDQLVVLAGLADQCDGIPDTFVIAQWYDPIAEFDRAGDVAVFLNSLDPTSIAVGFGGNIEHEKDCRKLDGETRAFNLRCDLPRNWLTVGADVVIRIHEGRTKRPYPLRIGIQ